MRTNYERELANRLKHEGKTFREISEIMAISISSVQNLTRKLKCDRKKRGRKFILSGKYKLRIKRSLNKMQLQKQKINSTKIMAECNLVCSKRTVQRHLKLQGLKYKNISKNIKLSADDKQKRLLMSTKWLSENFKWEKVVFVDEKVFSLDGPNHWKSYIKEKDDEVREIRVCGGGKLMVFLLVLPNGLLWYKIFHSTFRSNDYLELLKNNVFKIIKLNMRSFYYVEDNSRVHKSKIIQSFMKENDFPVVTWPARSADLNIVEDLWKMISNIVYDGPQFENKKQLEDKIRSSIHSLMKSDRSKILHLYATFRSRLVKVINKKGGLGNR